MPAKILFLILFSAGMFNHSAAQNLFANPGLEDINICVEYTMPCAPEAWYYIKPTTNPLVSARVAPQPFAGENVLLVPMQNLYNTKSPRPYVYTMLTCPLIKGEKYKLSFAINTAGRKFYNLDFYFSDKEPATRNFNTTGLTPSFSIIPDNLTGGKKTDWQAVTYEFTATGNEQFCMLGNLSAPLSYQFSERMNKNGDIYYFIDDITLSPVNPQPRCNDYEERIKTIYGQNFRHTDFILTYPDAIKPPTPVYIKDTIIIPAVFFETNSAVLRPTFKKLMDSITPILADKKIERIDIVGHTDNKGTPEKNIILSDARAASVKDYFISKLPQYADGIFTEGKGETQPVADNATVEGRTKNRRVEIILTRIVASE